MRRSPTPRTRTPTIGYVGEPKPVRTVRVEAAVDQIGGSGRAVIGDGRTLLFASDHPPFLGLLGASAAPHRSEPPQRLHDAAGATPYGPHTPRSSTPKHGVYGAQLAIPATSGRSPLRFPFPTFMQVVNRRGDRQLSAEQAQPHNPHGSHQQRWSSSRSAVEHLCLGDIRRRLTQDLIRPPQLPHLPAQLPQLAPLTRRQPRA